MKPLLLAAALLHHPRAGRASKNIGCCGGLVHVHFDVLRAHKRRFAEKCGKEKVQEATSCVQAASRRSQSAVLQICPAAEAQV